MSETTSPAQWPQVSEHGSRHNELDTISDGILVRDPEQISGQLEAAQQAYFDYDVPNVLHGFDEDYRYRQRELAIAERAKGVRDELTQITVLGPVAVNTLPSSHDLLFIDTPATVGALRILRAEDDDLLPRTPTKRFIDTALDSLKTRTVKPDEVLETLTRLSVACTPNGDSTNVVVPADCAPLGKMVKLPDEERDILLKAGLKGFVRQFGESSDGFLRYDAHEFLEILRRSESPRNTWQQALRPYLLENVMVLEELRNCSDDSFETLFEQAKAGLLNLAETLVAQRDYQ